MNRALLTALILTFSATLHAQEWGDLKLRFVYGGNPPVTKKLNVNGNFCGNLNLNDETLQISKTGGIANIFVIAYEGRGGIELPAIHPSAQPAKQTKILANKNCQFVPHALVLVAGDTLRVTNPDPTAHNVNLHFSGNEPRNLLIAPQKQEDFQVPKPEPVPANVECNIHPWMSARVYVHRNGYVGLSDVDGNVLIKNLPAGTKLAFRFIHERQKSMNGLKVGPGVMNRRNVVELTIRPGMNDLGEITIPAKMIP